MPKMTQVGFYMFLLFLISIFCLSACSSTDHFDESLNYITVPNTYPSIQEAINAAEDGDTIVVEPGIYRENIDYMGKAIVLQSTDPEDFDVTASTIIDGDKDRSVVTFSSGEPAEATISGFTITNGSGTWEELDYKEQANQFELKGYLGGGILVLNNSSPTITNNIIFNNKCAGEGGGGGIAIWNASATITGNTINQNGAPSGGGIFLGGGSGADIKKNTITGNNAQNGGGIYVGNHSNVSLEENKINDNEAKSLLFP